MCEDTPDWWECVVNRSILVGLPSLALRICEVAVRRGDEETIQLLSRLLLEMKAVGESVEAEVDQLLQQLAMKLTRLPRWCGNPCEESSPNRTLCPDNAMWANNSANRCSGSLLIQEKAPASVSERSD